MNGDENDVDAADFASATTETTTTTTTTLFFMLPVTLLEYILVDYLDVRSLVTLGKCHDMDDKVTEIALSSKTWDRLESQIKEGTSAMGRAVAKSAMDRVLRYHIANEYASNVESKIIKSIKVFKKDKLLWNNVNDAVKIIPKWTEEPFESAYTASKFFKYFVRISMLKFNNNSSSSIESRETTLVWKGFLRCIGFEKDEWNSDFTLKLKFPGGEAGIPWGICGFDAFGESWGETEGPMITVVAINNSLSCNTAIDQGVADGNVEPLCCFVFWDAFTNDWTEYEFDRMDSNRLIKKSAGFPMLSTPRLNRLGCAPFNNAENDRGYWPVDVRTAKLRTGRDTNGTGCRLLKLDVFKERVGGWN